MIVVVFAFYLLFGDECGEKRRIERERKSRIEEQKIGIDSVMVILCVKKSFNFIKNNLRIQTFE